jgi:hypothetical protein
MLNVNVNPPLKSPEMALKATVTPASRPTPPKDYKNIYLGSRYQVFNS